MEWQHSGSPRPPKKIPSAKNPLENSRLDFLGSRQHPTTDYLQRAKLSTRIIITHLSLAIEVILKGKRRGKFTKWVLFLHENAPAHRELATQKKLSSLGFQCLDHPPYSPDLAPSDYHLFSGLKKQLKGRHFSSDAEIIAAAETWLDGQLSEFF